MMLKKWLLLGALLTGASFSRAESLESQVLPKLAKEWQTAPGQFPPGRIKFTKDYRIISTPAFSDIEPQSGYFNFMSDSTIRISPDAKDQQPSDLIYVLAKNELKLTYATGESQLFVPAMPAKVVSKKKQKPVKKP